MTETPYYFYFGSYAHPFYRDLLRASPEGYRAIGSDQSVKSESNLRHVTAQGKSWTHGAKLRAVKIAGYPKLYSIKKPAECKFTHAAQYLLFNSGPYATDFEDASAFSWYDHRVLSLPWTRQIIKRSLNNKNCRAILPWTQAAKESLLTSIPKGAWHEKTEVLYPCLDASKFTVPHRKDNDVVEFLFVGNSLTLKGGAETIEAFKLLQKTHDVRLTVITKFTPEEFEKYGHIPGVQLLTKVPQEELDAAYERADAFIMPSHYDTFGLVFLEAMARGLPCIATDQFATPEIIEHGKTGLLIDNCISRFDKNFKPIRTHTPPDFMIKALATPPPKSVSDLHDAMAQLADSASMRRKFGQAGRASVESGRFSMSTRRKETKRIYDAAFAAEIRASQ